MSRINLKQISLLAFFIIGLPISFLAGGIYQNYLLFDVRYRAQSKIIISVANRCGILDQITISRDPEGFAHIDSNGISVDDLQELRSELIQAFGRPLTDYTFGKLSDDLIIDPTLR